MRGTLGLDECKILIATIFASILTACAMPVAGPAPGAKPAISYLSGNSYPCTPNPTTNVTECETVFHFPPGYVYPWGGGGTVLSGITVALIQDIPPKQPPYWPKRWVVAFDYYNGTVGWAGSSPPLVLFYLADQYQAPRYPPIAVMLTRQVTGDCTYFGNTRHQVSPGPLPASIDIQKMLYISYPADDNAPIPPNITPC
jgi:hypothetical protein